eukprot:1805130-Rhodomonas_salina.2
MPSYKIFQAHHESKHSGPCPTEEAIQVRPGPRNSYYLSAGHSGCLDSYKDTLFHPSALACLPNREGPVLSIPTSSLASTQTQLTRPPLTSHFVACSPCPRVSSSFPSCLLLFPFLSPPVTLPVPPPPRDLTGIRIGGEAKG